MVESKKRPIHRGICLVLALGFVVFAAVQFNDPDAAMWMGIYLATAIVCGLSAWWVVPWIVLLPAVIAAAFAAGLYWPDHYQGLANKSDLRPAVEMARESLGLVLVGLALTYVLVQGLRRRRR